MEKEHRLKNFNRKSTVTRACDVCSTVFEQRADSDTARKNGQWYKVFLCPEHKGYTLKLPENIN